jgi:hypothetical protein
MEHYTLQASSHQIQEFVGYTGTHSLRFALGSVSAWNLSLGQLGVPIRPNRATFLGRMV